MLNRAVLLGRLTNDPELRYTQAGTAVTTFTLAIDRRVPNQQGEREADFISIVGWSKLAELSAQYLKKGQQAAVEDRIQTRSYENKEGRKVYVTEIVAENVQFLSGGESKERGEKFNDDPYGKPGNPFVNDGKPIDISDDDLPFN